MKKIYCKTGIKQRIILLLFSLTLFTVTGCNSNSTDASSSEAPETDEVINPFDSDKANTTIMGGIAHGAQESNIDENGKLLLVFNGEDVRFEYYVNAYGQARSIGFLMFVNGVPQPYKIDTADAAYEYMHTFELEEDNVDYFFTFIFSPVTGEQGDTLTVDVTSIYNASFMPDMEESTSYGGYHAILPASYPMLFESDALHFDALDDKSFGTVSYSSEPVTNQLLETLTNNGLRDIDMDTFNSEVFSLMYFDGEMKSDNLQVTENGVLQIQYMLCGHAGLEYETTFYINHQPITSSEGLSHNTVISKGSISIITFDLDLSELEDFSTFYAISVPKNAADFPNDIFEILKTQSILLYK